MLSLERAVGLFQRAGESARRRAGRSSQTAGLAREGRSKTEKRETSEGGNERDDGCDGCAPAPREGIG